MAASVQREPPSVLYNHRTSRPPLGRKRRQMSLSDPRHQPGHKHGCILHPKSLGPLSLILPSLLHLPEFHLLLCDLSCFLPLLILLFLIYSLPPLPSTIPLCCTDVWTLAAPSNLPNLLKIPFSSTRGRLCFFFSEADAAPTGREILVQTQPFGGNCGEAKGRRTSPATWVGVTLLKKKLG